MLKSILKNLIQKIQKIESLKSQKKEIKSPSKELKIRDVQLTC